MVRKENTPMEEKNNVHKNLDAILSFIDKVSNISYKVIMIPELTLVFCLLVLFLYTH